MNGEEAMETMKRIEQLAYGGGERDDIVLREVRALLNRIRWAPFPETGMILSSVQRWFDILYSPRKHIQYGGIATVRSHIFLELVSLKDTIRKAAQRDM